MRDIYEKRQKWIGKIEKVILVISIPTSLIFMTVYAYVRSGVAIATKNIFKLFLTFSMDKE